ncbi:predicted protein [Thalassiosira pseudonana CCMP1335]|uniref:TLDc domain-containing protein n=1 Tax=Thalassiosira pseudonana TaxID=35128 RepID=B8BXH0_THAPS|nr:predicted protein [Thalassiosira pseudonana CCMP1335]EED93705.1 predicted protein [Thalassiosira pseudonana CCMP1335]|eukprot:g3376.t1 g3376   contig12:1957492-1958343(-)
MKRFAIYKAAALALPMLVASFTSSQHRATIRQPSNLYIFGNKGEASTSVTNERTYPESKPATYDLLPGNPFDFGPEGIAKQLLKQTQLENRKLKVIYNAKKDGWDARKFHQKVDGKGASVVLAKVRGQWIGGYNPRGWASLGGSRPSIASFLFYQKLFTFQKLRVNRTGGMACGRDEFDQGIYFGSDAFAIPLQGNKPRNVASRLGYFFECGPENKSTLLPVKGEDAKVEELYVVAGVYAPGEDIPNAGGVTDLGLY